MGFSFWLFIGFSALATAVVKKNTEKLKVHRFPQQVYTLVLISSPTSIYHDLALIHKSSFYAASLGCYVRKVVSLAKEFRCILTVGYGLKGLKFPLNFSKT